MFKNLNPEDVSIRPFQVYKRFTFSNSDSGSGVYAVNALSSSTYNFTSSGAPSQSFGVFNSLSSSLEKEPYWATFYKLPVYGTIKQLYYKDLEVHGDLINTEHWLKPSSSLSPVLSSSVGDDENRVVTTTYTSRQLGEKVNVITIPRKFFGERIRPGSVVLKDDSLDSTLELRDDSQGNLYDFAYSQSYSLASQSLGSDGQISGSVVGNIVYEHGIIAITDTGSAYGKVGETSGSDGWEVKFQSTHTIYEREYVCSIQPNELQRSTNISLFPEYSGSWKMGSGSVSPFISASDSIFNVMSIPPGSSSYKEFYNATASFLSVVTASEFAPYITTVALYNDQYQRLAVGKLSRPIKNDPDLSMTFVVRFDT